MSDNYEPLHEQQQDCIHNQIIMVNIVRMVHQKTNNIVYISEIKQSEQNILVASQTYSAKYYQKIQLVTQLKVMMS